MNILTLNVGSSSVKYALYGHKYAAGTIERVGEELSYKQAFSILFRELTSVLGSLERLDAIAHRVVHAGTIQHHSRITPRILRAIEQAAPLAPLHDIPELKGIHICMRRVRCPQFALLDTAFHETIPAKASAYALPSSLTKRYHIHRFGFHGLSYAYITKYLKKHYTRCKKVIVCHLGNGASIAAIRNGKSVDTSMGFTPLEGLMMGSRSGDLDPGLLLYLMGKYSKKQLSKILNTKSGLLGVGGSNDMRDLCAAKSERARSAIDQFCYRVTKYIGAYAAALDGIDALIFTAGIGENEPSVRHRICQSLSHLGIRLDAKKNRTNKECISSGKTKVLVIPTDESQVMVEETRRLLRDRKA